jgi:hypothetical protein
MVMRKAKRIKHNKLILNSHNKAKPTWGMIKNPEEIKKEEIKDLNFEGRKITDQQTIAETINPYFVVIAENVKN